MTVVVRGQDAFRTFLRDMPAKLEANVLRGGLTVLAGVVAEEAKVRCRDPEVAETIGVTRPRLEKGIVTAKVRLKGAGAFKGVFLEWGTAMHVISARDEARDGKTVKRLNMELKRGSLVIGGKFVGASVVHPGARPYPFLRPALDAKLGEGLTKMGAYLQMRLDKHGFDAPDLSLTADEE